MSRLFRDRRKMEGLAECSDGGRTEEAEAGLEKEKLEKKRGETSKCRQMSCEWKKLLRSLLVSTSSRAEGSSQTLVDHVTACVTSA